MEKLSFVFIYLTLTRNYSFPENLLESESMEYDLQENQDHAFPSNDMEWE